VHAWAAWHVYNTAKARDGKGDTEFLTRVFNRLMLNFTWWANRKDVAGSDIFAGGFLGLDNIGLWDRSQPLPPDVLYGQADGTAWVAFFSLAMLRIALELVETYPFYEDMVIKFFVHFIGIADAMNRLGGTGLWDEEDEFYYDVARVGQAVYRMRVRSLVGLIPLIAVVEITEPLLERLPHFKERVQWFWENRPDLIGKLAYMDKRTVGGMETRLLALPAKDRLEPILRYMFREDEFLSAYGIRGLSRFHRDRPATINVRTSELRSSYEPSESTTGLFGGNSNWRGPIWMPVNYLLVEALGRYGRFYGDDLKVEYPTGSGNRINLVTASQDLSERLSRLFLRDGQGRRPCHGKEARYVTDPNWRDYPLFYEYFDGDTGRGCGASHQTGWTALIAPLLDRLAAGRDAASGAT
jgi:hypothetical protein